MEGLGLSTTRHNATWNDTTQHDTTRHNTTRHTHTQQNRTQHDTHTQHDTTQHDTHTHTHTHNRAGQDSSSTHCSLEHDRVFTWTPPSNTLAELTENPHEGVFVLFLHFNVKCFAVQSQCVKVGVSSVFSQSTNLMKTAEPALNSSANTWVHPKPDKSSSSEPQNNFVFKKLLKTSQGASLSHRPLQTEKSPTLLNTASSSTSHFMLWIISELFFSLDLLAS